MFELTNQLFIDILLFLLIFFICFAALIRFYKNKAISSIIAIAISLIAVFYLPYSQLIFLAKSYNIIGTILLCAIPFIMVFYFLYSSNIHSIFRKIIWIFYAVMNIVLLNNNSFITSETTTQITLIIIFILIIILLFDKSIKNKFNERKNLKKY